MNNGWIKLHRKMVDWEWYSDTNVFRVFIHLLLTANHEEKRWKGVLIEEGQKVTGRKSLAKILHISEQSVRTALERLKSTNEITIKTTNKYSVITILKWKHYQQTTSKLTNKQPTTNQQLTTNKNDKNEKNDKNNYGEFKNVLLTENELTQLREKLSIPVVETLIAELDEYIESKGVKYKSHSATIQSWARRRINDHVSKLKAPNVYKV